MVRLILRCFDLFARLIRRFGVDYDQFRAILGVRLVMDNRRHMSAMRNEGQKKPRNTFFWTLCFYTFMGLFMSTMMFQIPSALAGVTIIHAFVMTMVGMSLVADLSAVLLDTTDVAILHPRPVSGRTLLAARIAHISAYLSLLALSLSAGSMIAGSFAYHPLFSVVFLATLVCSVVMVVFLAQVAYLVAMRLTDTERFRDLILYCQIGMTLVMLGGYQVMPRLMSLTSLKTLTIDDRWWIYYFPPAWFAAPIDLLTGHVGVVQIVLSVLAFVVPAVCLIVVAGPLAPGFSRALSKLHDGPTAKKSTTDRPNRPAIGSRIARVLTASATERAAFELCWQLTGRDRSFKQRTYPTVAFSLIMGGVMVFNTASGATDVLGTLRESKVYLFALYIVCMMAPITIIQLRFTTQLEAAWVYFALPIARPGDVLVAAFKVAVVRFALPVFFVVAVLTFAVWGVGVLDDIILAACAALLGIVLQALVFGRYFPFSEEFVASEQTGQLGRSILLFLVPATMALIHYVMLLIHPVTVWVGIPLVLIAFILLIRSYAQTSWPEMRRATAR